MIRVTGRYANQAMELAQPLDLPEGTEVEVEIEPVDDALKRARVELGMGRLEAAWDNPQDAIYDDWRTLYGV